MAPSSSGYWTVSGRSSTANRRPIPTSGDRRAGGKSAVVTALFEHLSRQVASPTGGIVTSTRRPTDDHARFVYVDARTATSEFQLYRRVLAGVSSDVVPEGGVSTAELRDWMADTFERPGPVAVVAVDHVDEPETLTVDAVDEAFARFDRVAWLCVGRDPPADVPAQFDRTVEVPAYDSLALEDVLSTRASNGLAPNALTHGQVRQVAAWAEGDAHDALAALAGAAEHAREQGRDAIGEQALAAGMDAVPRGGAPVARLLALPANRRSVLRALVDADPGDRSSVDAAAGTLADHPGVDLSAGTVRRFLYELADWGILELVTNERDDAEQGRPPSRVVPRFPTLVFRRLHDDGRRGTDD